MSPRNVVGILVGFALFASACTATSEVDETVRDDRGAVVEGGEVGVFALNVGDCFTDVPTGTVESIEAVPCAGEHGVEIYHLFDVSLDSFDEEEVSTSAGDGCLAAFEGYVGTSYANSIYYSSSLNPSDQSWKQGDREVVCMLFPVAAEGEPEPATTSGTARGSKL